MNHVLMIAFHFPPYAGSSGLHRIVRFAQHLPASGWSPLVLTAHPRAYSRLDWQQYHDLVAGIPVARAFALDAARHLAIAGRYARWTALPDRWASWWPGAVRAGLRLVRKHRPQAIWSTYPIATAHLIGLTLHRLTGLPWLADFRDPMTDEGYPKSAALRQSYTWIEQLTARFARRLVFTTRSTEAAYRARYPSLEPRRTAVIANGFDEEDYVGLRQSGCVVHRNGRQPLRLLHAGILYPEERDPGPLFRALARLRRDGEISADRVTIDLRASGSEEYLARVIRELGLEEMVHLRPPLPFHHSLEDAAAADALLLLQNASCNAQIPAKAYEYLRLGRPILALTPEHGDTAQLFRETGGATIVDLEDDGAIADTLPRFLRAVHDDTHPLPDPQTVRRYARPAQTRALAACLDLATT